MEASAHAGLDAALEREALRVYRRYQLEVVEALDLCPWAERARLQGRVAERVLLQDDADMARVLAVVAELAASARIEIGVLLFPRLALGVVDFERFVARLRDADTARYPFGAGVFAMAAFHPDAKADVSEPERLIPFLRRTPDPTIQLVRMTALEEVRRNMPHGTELIDELTLGATPVYVRDAPSLRERIARSNLGSVQRAGLETVRALLDDIQRDRDGAYARLAAGSR